MTIQPTAVYPPSRRPASAPATGGGQQRFYQTYNTRYVQQPNPGPSGGSSSGFNYQGGRFNRYWNRIPQGPLRVQTPTGMPKWLGARPIILFAWVAAMAMVALDEWHTYHILPRPARLWYTTLTYLLLGVVSAVDAAVPIANILAIGFTIAVAYNYYSGNGGFGGFGPAEVTQSEQSGGTNASS